MKNLLRLSTMPLVGLLLLCTAYFWSERDLRLRVSGESTEGRIIGMALQREDGRGDLLTGLDTELVLTTEDGARLLARFRNYEFRSASLLFADGTSRDLAASDLEGGSPDVSPMLAGVVADSLRGEAEVLRWALLREERRSADPRRVRRIDKTETVRGYFDLKSLPVVLTVRDGEVVMDPAGEASAVPGTVRIRAVFDRSNAETLLKSKGEPMVSYEYLRGGKACSPEQKNFFLHAEPYSTQFFPVFGFDVGGNPLARLSHIGRHGGPTLALQLFERCRVYYDPQRPSEAILMAVPGPVNGDPLGWFSRLCEGVFGQWGSASLMVLAELGFILTGLIFISLLVLPHLRTTNSAPCRGDSDAQRCNSSQ